MMRDDNRPGRMRRRRGAVRDKPLEGTEEQVFAQVPAAAWKDGLAISLARVRDRGWSPAAFRGVVLAATLAALAGCAAPEPWVKPYEREALADPVMQLSRNPMMDGYRQHVFDVREGSRGATDSEGGGCGCN